MLNKYKNTRWYNFLQKKIFLLAIVSVWVLFSAPTLFFGKTPFPSTYQVNFFAPSNAYPGMGGPVKNNAQPDIISQIYPWRYFSIQELKNGRIPFWNPYSFAGTPHLANYQSAVLSPFNVLFLLPIPFIDVWSWLVILQPLLAGLFVYLLARKLSISKAGSYISSISFMFCGFLVTWLGYASLGFAILPLPLALYSIVQFVESQRLRWLMLLAITFPLSFFAGHFQTSIYFALSVFLFVLYSLFTIKKTKSYVFVFVFCLVGLLLTMPQILPSMEFYSHTVRSELFQKMEAIPLNYIITLFVPDFYGNPVTRNDWFGHYAEWNGFAGLIALSIALFTILFKRTRKTLFFILLSLFSLLLALDTPLLEFLVTLKIPVLSTSAAGRIIVLFSFSIALLAGFGLDALYENRHQKKKLAIWLILLFSLFIFCVYSGLSHIQESEKIKIAQKNSVLPIATFATLVLVSISTFFIKSKKLLTLSLLVLLTFSTFEMYRFASKWQNFDPKNLVFVDVPVTKFYDAQNHFDRAVGLAGGEDAVYYKMPALIGYDPLFKAEYGQLLKFVDQGAILNPERSVVAFPYKGKYSHQALNFLGVKYVVHKVSDGTFPWAFPFKDYPPSQFTKIYNDSIFTIFRNNESFERAFIVGQVRELSHSQIPQAMFENDLKKIAFVEEKLPVSIMNSSGSAQILKYDANTVRIKTLTTGVSLLVLTDNFYPGWNVKINGEKQKIYKTNYSFRGVIVPKGESIVEFSYTPFSFLIGVYLAGIGILCIVVLLVLSSMTKIKSKK